MRHRFTRLICVVFGTSEWLPGCFSTQDLPSYSLNFVSPSNRQVLLGGPEQIWRLEDWCCSWDHSGNSDALVHSQEFHRRLYTTGQYPPGEITPFGLSQDEFNSKKSLFIGRAAFCTPPKCCGLRHVQGSILEAVFAWRLPHAKANR